MIVHPATMRTGHQDLINELHTFILGTANLARPNAPELTKTALRLLKSLPAARTAIFQYFNNVFEELAAHYVREITMEMKSDPSGDGGILSDIYVVLANFIGDNPTAWAPIISTWSLDLLGEISSKFAGQGHVSSDLNETLQFWINCRATKVLVDVNTKCFSSLMHSNTESCISALLDTSMKHSPNFDWVVAHIGRCFPHTVITRVLTCGLKDFCQIKSYEHGSNSLKLKSVVGILDHLARSHSNDIHSAVSEMFFWSLNVAHHQPPSDGDDVKQQKRSTVPFILQLSLLSSTFFSSVFSDIKRVLSVDVLESMSLFTDDWCKYFGSSEQFEEILINLILNCDNCGLQLINLFFSCILTMRNDHITNAINDKSLGMLQNILYRIDEQIRHVKVVKFLNSFTNDNCDDLHKLLLCQQQLIIKAQTAAQLTIFLGHNNVSTLLSSVNYLFQYSQNGEQLALLIKILTCELNDRTLIVHAERGGAFAVVFEQVLSRKIDNHNLGQTWRNLLVLVHWEKSGRIPLMNNQIVSRAIMVNLSNLASLFGRDAVHVHQIAEILDQLDVPSVGRFDNLPVDVVLKLTQATINYFFACCSDRCGSNSNSNSTTSRKVRGFKKAARLLRRLCTYSKVAKVFALRELLERALFRNDNMLFGAKSSAMFDENGEKLLLEQNMRINKTIPLTKHSSVFNGGIIGRGKRKMLTVNVLPPETVACNIVELINVIKSCCALPECNENKYLDVSLDSLTLVSLLLVQFVSPDVMYNGLPWPDEEFSKVTVERDLFIHRLFNNLPVLWELLNFVAVYRPALCYCSVLIRAMTATLIHQWKSTSETKSNKNLLNTTVRVIDILAAGQLLPPPLSNIRDVLPYLKCFEIVAVLKDCVWCYMRDHIPSPALFAADANVVYWRDPTVSRPAEIYTHTLRIIMQRNIETLGHMYSQMFINIPKQE